MMAIESSVLGCGSDDWSVDSDYAFEDFGEDVQQLNEQQQLVSVPEGENGGGGGAPSVPGGIRSTGTDNSEDEDERSGLEVRPDAEIRVTLPAGEDIELPEKEVLRERRLDAAGPSREQQQPCMSEPRLLGDPGSSTESTHILRLEQRMFLKVHHTVES